MLLWFPIKTGLYLATYRSSTDHHVFFFFLERKTAHRRLWWNTLLFNNDWGPRLWDGEMLRIKLSESTFHILCGFLTTFWGPFGRLHSYVHFCANSCCYSNLHSCLQGLKPPSCEVIQGSWGKCDINPRNEYGAGINLKVEMQWEVEIYSKMN